jgi:hypothetical protein
MNYMIYDFEKYFQPWFVIILHLYNLEAFNFIF